MFFILSKILSFLSQPITWVILLLLIGLLKKDLRRKKKFFIASFVLLYLFSNQALFHEFSAAWESKAVSEDKLKPSYEVAVVLGGLLSVDGEQESIDFNGSADRIFQVLPLYHSGRVKRILISGGSGRLLAKEKEADWLKKYLIQLKIPAEDILVESESRNTYENAKYSIALLKQKQISGPILLCTSAAHMPRSFLCFKKQGADVDAFPVDPASLSRALNPEALFIPKASILQDWYHLIHEWIGICTYKLAGYC